MRQRPGQLTHMERTFSAYMARTGDALYAATRAGYKAPNQAASQNMRNADVVSDMRRQAQSLLRNEGAQIGVAVLVELACDSTQKGSTRGAAAKSLVQLSGIAGPQALSEGDLADMPADKIRELLAEAQRALEARMKVVNTLEHEPIEQPESPLCAQAAPNLFD